MSRSSAKGSNSAALARAALIWSATGLTGLQTVRVGLAKPVCETKRLTRLLCEKIETVEPGLGIEIMTLAATLAEPLQLKQAVSSPIEETGADVSGLSTSLPTASANVPSLWAIRVLRDEPLPLFASAAERQAEEAPEPAIVLKPMAAGGDVVEDYQHVGLSLRDHPVSFLRSDLRRKGIVSCQAAMDARDGRWLEAAGIVLVRQRPGSAKGVMFITLEDETGIANLVVWPKVFERFRRTILSAGMISVRGRIQREGEVTYLPTSPASGSVNSRSRCLMDEVTNSNMARRHRTRASFHPKGLRTRDIYIPTCTSARSR